MKKIFTFIFLSFLILGNADARVRKIPKKKFPLRHADIGYSTPKSTGIETALTIGVLGYTALRNSNRDRDYHIE